MTQRDSSCERHPSLQSQPRGGVCSGCLRERLISVWRGQSFHGEKRGEEVKQEREEEVKQEREEEVNQEREKEVNLEREKEVNQEREKEVNLEREKEVKEERVTSTVVVDSSFVAKSENLAVAKSDVIVEWTEFHARRRRGLDSETQSRSFDLSEVKEEEEVVMEATPRHVRRGSMERSPQLRVLMSAQKLQTRSMPLDNRAAEDTASRVIREEADELYADELDLYLDGLQERVGDGEEPQAEQRSVKWSPKWMRALLSPVMSRNKVFPSRSKEDVARKAGRGARKGKLTRFASSDWSQPDANGAASPHWMDVLLSKEGLPEARRRSTIRSSVLSWLQDSERTKIKKYEQSRLALSSSSMSAIPEPSTDTLLRDLITVGHLHEIAEEIEEEDEGVMTPDSLDDVASFGKFLLSAAQRQPNLASLMSLSRTASC